MKSRQLAFGLIAVIVVALALYGGTHRHARSDQSDLTVLPARATILAGHGGAIDVRVANFGPDAMRHTVTFTVTTADPHVMIAGGGSVAAGEPDIPFEASTCAVGTGGHSMTCTVEVSLGVSHHLLWRIPVRVTRGAPANTTLTVTAVGSSSYTDPRQANNTTHLTVRAGSSGVRTAPSPAPSSKPPPARPSPSQPSPTVAAKKAHNGAAKTLAPVTIALCLLVGLVALAVAGLVLVSRRQQKLPLHYIPPRRDKRL